MKKNVLIYLLCAVAPLVASSCNKDTADDACGYIQLDVNTLVSTIESKATAAPSTYAPRQLYVEIRNDKSEIIKFTNDYEKDASFKDAIKLAPGTYTINAHSYNWDGSDSGIETPYYAGSATANVQLKKLVPVKLTCTLANVKVTVSFDNSFRTNFRFAEASVKSLLSGVTSRDFVMGEEAKAAYFPVGDIALKLDVENMAGTPHIQRDTVRGVSARDHIKITYKVAPAGSLGGVSVNVNDQDREYIFNVPIPRKPGISFECNKANAWSNFAYLTADITGKTSTFDYTKVIMQYRKADEALWTDIANSDLSYDGQDRFSYKLTGLSAQTAYEFRIRYASEEPVDSEARSFTTEAQTSLYSPGFENWCQIDNAWYPNKEGDAIYWNSSNPGSAGFSVNVTTPSTTFAHSGSYSAKLASTYVAGVKFAAASIYIGQFKGLIGTNGAKLDWGTEFTSRPTVLKGYWSYAPGSINRGNQPSGAPAKGSNDACQIFCVLLTEQLHVGGNASKNEYEKSTEINWNTDSRVIAYGEITKDSSSNGQWEEFKVNLKYHDLNKKPAYMAIVCAASKWGDYFYGSDSTVLYLDDLSFEYGDNPSTQN